MRKIISNYDELPLQNKKVYDLVLAHADGNVKMFSDHIGVAQQVLDRVFKKDTRNGKYPSVSEGIKDAIKNKFNVDNVWFLLDNTNSNEKTIECNVCNDCKKLDEIKDFEMVPLINKDSVGGMHSLNKVNDCTEYIERHIPFQDSYSGDICIIETGDSMSPTCPPGSVLLIRNVPFWYEFFGYGNIFVIELKDGRRITKEVCRYDENPKEYVWCKSHNTSVQDEELPKSMIVSVWKVIKILTDKGW